jgi:hypothetical protein
MDQTTFEQLELKFEQLEFKFNGQLDEICSVYENENKKSDCMRNYVKEIYENFIVTIITTLTNFVVEVGKDCMIEGLQVDKHVFDKDGNLKFVIECKAWLDKAMFARAVCDYMLMLCKNPDKDFELVVFAGQNSINDTWIVEYSNMCQKFVGHTPKVIFLHESKRRGKTYSRKDRDFFKLNRYAIIELIDYLNAKE